MVELVAAMKFDADRQGADDIGRILARNYSGPAFDVATYVPTDPKSVRHRSYDHAQRIVESFAAEYGCERTRLLSRKPGVRQKGSSRVRRQKQMEGVFRPVNIHLSSGATVLVIDDVLSTGATLESAAKTLKQAGAKQVLAMVAAHNR